MGKSGARKNQRVQSDFYRPFSLKQQRSERTTNPGGNTVQTESLNERH
jgi:hypothetical protein